MSQFDMDSTPKRDATKARQSRFLKAFAEQANVWTAARAAKVHRTTVYVWLEHDEDFNFAFNQAKEDAKDVLRAEIYRRGKEGWDAPVYQGGVLVGKVRKYSDALLLAHAKALMPEYRDQSKLDLNANVSTTQQAGIINIDTRQLSNEALAKLKQIAMDMKSREEGNNQ